MNKLCYKMCYKKKVFLGIIYQYIYLLQYANIVIEIFLIKKYIQKK